jgi:hypothetical protein
VPLRPWPVAGQACVSSSGTTRSTWRGRRQSAMLRWDVARRSKVSRVPMRAF